MLNLKFISNIYYGIINMIIGVRAYRKSDGLSGTNINGHTLSNLKNAWLTHILNGI